MNTIENSIKISDDVDFAIENMSPMSNLAHNLSQSHLSSSIAGTPNRRISWSNPLPGGDKIGLNLSDISPSCDSPTFPELTPQQKPLAKPRRYVRKSFMPSPEEDKENLSPKHRSLSIPAEFEKEVFEQSSQDSGFSSQSFLARQKSLRQLSCSSVSSIACKMSQGFFEDEDSMENIFHMDSSQDSPEFSAMPDMSSLLTKPLHSDINASNPTPEGRKLKLPIRRCLSMDVDTEHSPLAVSTSSTYLISENPFENPDHLNDNGKGPFKRPDPPDDHFICFSKRRKSMHCIEVPTDPPPEQYKIKRSYSETAATIMHAILKSDLQPELVGDGSRSCALPLAKGRHQDLKSISPETLARLLNGEFKEVENVVLVDCRYPYEFEGGHIIGAQNIFTKEAILQHFLNEPQKSKMTSVIIFHCEFSSERAPTLCRFLRNKDRELNQGNYPHLFHPEVYILEGGYKAFFNAFKELCEPQEYKPMNHKDHGFELRHFRAKSKSCGADFKGRPQKRPFKNSNFS